MAAPPPESKIESELEPEVESENVAAPFDDMVTVLDSGDAIRIAMAKGILRDAGIPFYVAGESYGTRPDYAWRQILVERGSEAEARNALELIEGPAAP